MTSIGPLSISSIEEAFGLKPGDLQLVSDTEVSSPYLVKNGWTDLEGFPLRVTRAEVTAGTFMSKFASMATLLSSGVIEMAPGGSSYDEHFVHNIMRLYNSQVHYEVVAYVNEKCRIVYPSSQNLTIPLSSKSTVEKMTDLVMTTLCNEQCEEGEVSAYYYEGPNHGKYADYKSC